jgi:hypothetical protein
MKKLLLILTLICLTSFANAQLINFEDTSTLKNIKIDTANHNNIWQIGKPDKVFFSSAHSLPNAIVTDTINPYPTNNNSVFILRAVNCVGSGNFFLQFTYKINTDSLNDYGTLEASPDNGITWIDIIKDAQLYGYRWSVDGSWTLFSSQNNDTLPFTGTSNGWYDFTFFTNYAGPLVTNNFLLFKFTFHSDNIQTNKSGWMIDDMSTGIWESINELDNNVFYSTVYPNPATNNMIIESSQQATMEILNIQGQTILQQQLQQGKTDIDISGLAKGVYILRMCSNDKTEVTRFVKE